MEKMGDMLLRQEAFSEIVMGNIALVRAMIETKTRVVTSYPGSPTPEIAIGIKSIQKGKRPFYFEFSVNEKVATEVAYGATINGHLSAVFFKSVGLNVASDIFVQLSMMNLIGGMVIILGDDPGANSSQNEQDNRHYALMSYTPMLEPSNPKEVYSYYTNAVDLSKKFKIPVILRLTTHVCHAKEKVAFSSYIPEPLVNLQKFDPSNGPYIPITSDAIKLKRINLYKLDEIKKYIVDSNINTTIDNANNERGIIVAGLPYLSLQDSLVNVPNKPDILKLGCVYPLNKDQINSFLDTHNEVKVIEELDNILEKEVKLMAFDKRAKVSIVGKIDLEDTIGEYTPDRVKAILNKTWPNLLPENLSPSPKITIDIPIRRAQLCPGCGHRSAFYAVKQALKNTDITVADIGCHTMGYYPPHEMGQLLMCMGASIGISSGLSLFSNKRKVVAFMGDSTFFHAAMPGVVNAIFNKHNLTMILMENGTTAMTGHQDNPSSGKNFDGYTEKISIETVLRAFGVKHIHSADSYQQDKLIKAVKASILLDEFSVVIASHPCMLKFTKKQKQKSGYKKRQVYIDISKCNESYLCVEAFACPSFTRNRNGKIKVNPDLCIGDSSCKQTCPAKAINLPNEKGN